MEREQIFGLLREWVIAQSADQDKIFDQLIFDSKTLWDSAAQRDGGDGATRVVTQVTHAHELGVAIAQPSFDTGKFHEATLKALLSTLEIEGVLIQADALHSSPAQKRCQGWQAALGNRKPVALALRNQLDEGAHRYAQRNGEAPILGSR